LWQMSELAVEAPAAAPAPTFAPPPFAPNPTAHPDTLTHSALPGTAVDSLSSPLALLSASAILAPMNIDDVSAGPRFPSNGDGDDDAIMGGGGVRRRKTSKGGTGGKLANLAAAAFGPNEFAIAEGRAAGLGGAM